LTIMMKRTKAFHLSGEVLLALEQGRPLVALETAVVTHGLPYPHNLQLARQMEQIVREHGAIPATIAVLDGRIRVGIEDDQLERLAVEPGPRKISRRDFAPAVIQRASGGTTVAGTLAAAAAVGIRVFATGGIGGVHRGAPFDISTDLPELGRSPLVVVCAGAKAILDLLATLEYLETQGVPVVSYQCDEFPAFYARSSGLRAPFRVDSPEEAAALAKAHWELGLESAVLLAVPPPAETAMPQAAMEQAIAQALAEAQAQGISGQAVTPFLLSRVSQITGGASLEANLGLLHNNAGVASQVALRLAKGKTGRA
jgi:pseudouridine-5'-phosphate glycosidase